MNYRLVARLVSYIMLLTACLMSAPMAVAVFTETQTTYLAFAVTIALLIVFAAPSAFVFKPKDKSIYAKDAFVVVAGAWFVLAFFGSLPYFISGLMGGFVDCLFESVSGFTTTGATMLTDVESLPASLLLWRSMTHWIGGLGILMFLLAIISFSGGQSFYIMRAETTGPTITKAVAKVSETARILYTIYFALTLLTFLALMLCGMPLFDSINHAFATVATGGFSIKNNSIAYYDSAAIDGVLTFFMFVSGINFNLLYLLILRRFAQVFKNDELRVYVFVVLIGITLISLNLFFTFAGSLGYSLRLAAFQTVSILTTTGFATAAFEGWPQLSKACLLIMMMLGGCAGSTAGGIKIIRGLFVFKIGHREMKRLLHPRAVDTININGKPIDDSVLRGVNAYICAYLLLFFLSFIIISSYNFDLETTISAVAACFGNVGPGLGSVGGMGNYSFWPPVAKIVLLIDMLFGRLEIFPVLLFFLPEVWRARKPVSKKANGSFSE